jgi:hypothetical protein
VLFKQHLRWKDALIDGFQPNPIHGVQHCSWGMDHWALTITNQGSTYFCPDYKN